MFIDPHEHNSGAIAAGGMGPQREEFVEKNNRHETPSDPDHGCGGQPFDPRTTVAPQRNEFANRRLRQGKTFRAAPHHQRGDDCQRERHPNPHRRASAWAAADVDRAAD